MQRLYLFKQTNTPSLAHLYEHLFCASLEQYFLGHNLYQRLDYSLFAKTSDAGTIFLDLILLSKRALTVSRKIPKLKCNISDDPLVTGITQVLAEYEQPVVCKDFEQLKTQLAEIDSKEWINLDEFNVIDTFYQRKAYPIFYIAKGMLPARKLALSIQLNPNFINSDRKLLPLFKEIAALLIDNLEEALANKFGYYSSDYEFDNSKNSIKLTNVFKVANANDPYFELCFKAALEIVKQLKNANVVSNFTKILGSTHYHNDSGYPPNPIRICDETSVVIGEKGWQELATQYNLEALLKHMSLELKFGRKKLVASLASI